MLIRTFAVIIKRREHYGFYDITDKRKPYACVCR